MEAKARERLYRLVAGLPDGAVNTVEHFLETLSNSDDPVGKALMNAHEDDETLTEEDRAGLDDAQAAFEAGDVVGDEHLREELGL